MNASGEDGGCRSTPRERADFNAEDAEGREMRKKEDPRSQTRAGVPRGMTLGGSVNIQKKRELGVHFSS